MASVPAARLSPAADAAELPFWEKVFPFGQRRVWAAGASLLCQEEKAEGIHFILSGDFRAVVFGRSGQQRTLWIMRKHSLIGEVSMLTNSPAIYLMECGEKGETVFFPRRVLLEEVLPAYPGVSLSIMRILAFKLRIQSEDVQAWNFMSAPQRVGKFLLRRSSETGGPIRISHAELAEFLGLHRVTVTRAVAQLREAGLIGQGENGVTVPDPDRLAREIYRLP